MRVQRRLTQHQPARNHDPTSPYYEYGYQDQHRAQDRGVAIKIRLTVHSVLQSSTMPSWSSNQHHQPGLRHGTFPHGVHGLYSQYVPSNRTYAFIPSSSRPQAPSGSPSSALRPQGPSAL